MMEAWERESPGRIETIARALGDIRPSQLSDPKLFDFLALGARGDGRCRMRMRGWRASRTSMSDARLMQVFASALSRSGARASAAVACAKTKAAPAP